MGGTNTWDGYIYSFTEYFLTTFCSPSTVLGGRDMDMNKTVPDHKRVII